MQQGHKKPELSKACNLIHLLCKKYRRRRVIISDHDVLNANYKCSSLISEQKPRKSRTRGWFAILHWCCLPCSGGVSMWSERTQKLWWPFDGPAIKFSIYIQWVCMFMYIYMCIPICNLNVGSILITCQLYYFWESTQKKIPPEYQNNPCWVGTNIHLRPW